MGRCRNAVKAVSKCLCQQNARRPEGGKEHLLCLTWKATEKLMFWVVRRNKLPMGCSTCSLVFGTGHFNLGILSSRRFPPPHPTPHQTAFSWGELPKNTEIVIQMAECQASCLLGFKKPSISWLLGDRGRVCRRGSLLKPGASGLLFLMGTRVLRRVSCGGYAFLAHVPDAPESSPLLPQSLAFSSFPSFFPLTPSFLWWKICVYFQIPMLRP